VRTVLRGGGDGNIISLPDYLVVLRLRAHSTFSKLTITQLVRQLSREHDLRDFLATHFHDPFSIT